MSEILGNDFTCGREPALSRFRRTDDGSVAVLAALTFPVVLLTVGLAFAAYVWTSSEHEEQRAADAAAVRAAATAFLGTDFPYDEIPGVSAPVTYPNVQAIAAAFHTTAPHNLDQCGTVGLPPTAAMVPGGITLPADCSGVGPFAVPPPLGATDQSWTVACDTARTAMVDRDAPYANRFYDGHDQPQPSCANDASTGRPRIDVRLSTGNPLLGFGQHATNTASGALDTAVAPQAATVRQLLAAFGVHLDTSLPSLMCPEVNVRVNQPVREPVFDRASVPNGRATARRVVKNAVVVPVYQGATLTPVPDDVVAAAAGGVDVPGTTASPLHVPPQNLNALLISAQAQLLTLLDEVDAITDAAVRAANVSVDRLNGVYSGIDPTVAQPPPLPATAPLQALGMTKCLHDTLTEIYDPPSGQAPTADEVLANAAADGEAVIAVQVGVVKASCTEPGAIPFSPGTATPAATPQCIRAATTPQVNPATGVYEVPFFDATPVLVQDVGHHNYEAVPLHATQASGAFRAALVRSHDDERFDPDLTQPIPLPQCAVAVAPTPSPLTGCAILSISPSPLPTFSPTPPPTVLPTPSPTPSATTSPTPVPTLPTLSPTPLPTLSPSKTPTPSCVILCGVH
jgi:hypothetical protein